jgi:hypothetical protein
VASRRLLQQQSQIQAGQTAAMAIQTGIGLTEKQLVTARPEQNAMASGGSGLFIAGN